MGKESLTIKGLEYLVYASLVTVIWGLMPAIALIDYYYLKTSMLQNIWWSILYLCFYGIGAILLIVGLYRMWQGKDEFGKEHTINIDKTLWFIIVILAITALISGPATMIISTNITIMFSFFLLTLMIITVPLFLIKSLSSAWIKKLLVVGVFIFVILFCISIILEYFFDYYYWDISLRIIFILSDLMPYILVLNAYYMTLINIRKNKTC